MDNSLSYDLVKKQVVSLLKEYRKLPGLIDAAEAKAAGNGISTPAEIEDGHFKQLATIGRAYTTDIRQPITRGRAEDLFYHLKGKDADDQVALDEIAGVLIGTMPRQGVGELDPTGRIVVTHQREMELAAIEAKRLRNRKEMIERAMQNLKGYEPHLEKLLRMRYMDGERNKITTVCQALGIQERTQDIWHRKAICEIAPLLGIGLGY